MNTEKNNQKIIGDNNSQNNINTVVINNYDVSEEKIKEIASDCARKIIKENCSISENIIKERIDKCSDLIIKKLEENFNLSPFLHPRFNYIYRKVLVQAAQTDDLAIYDMLSNLLMHRTKTNNNFIKTGIEKSIEIINQIDDTALIGLTIFVCIKYKLYANFWSLSDCLTRMNEHYSKIIEKDLPCGYDWIDQLDILQAIRIDTSIEFNKFVDYMSKQFNRIINVGIKENSSNFYKAKVIEEEIGLQLLFENELLNGYYVIPIFDDGQLNEIKYVSKNGISYLSKEKYEKIITIFDLYENNIVLLNKVKSNFLVKIQEFEYIKKIQIWWDSLNIAFRTTCIGNVIGLTNAKNKCIGFPSLDTILK